MRAAVFERFGEPLQIREVPTPHPGPGEVLVRIAASGVCFTDIKVGERLATTLPMIPGYEPVGVVAGVGDGVASVQPWDRVCVHAGFSCGRCAGCLTEGPEACVRAFAAFAGIARDGGYAEYMIAPADHVVALPDGLDFAEAAPLLCAGLTTFAAFRKAGLRSGQRAAVVGIGGLGHLAISIGTALGAQIYAVTSSPNKAGDAYARGAVFAGSTDAVVKRLRRDGGADVVLNTVDNLEPLTALVPGLASGAGIVLAAGSGDALPVTADQLIVQQLRVHGSFFGSTRDLRDLVELAVTHDIRPQIQRYRLDDVNTVHQLLRDNKIRYRAVLEL
jgi:D-arabinose 1-dehydrogenase-like Zn-dependent alcohol dehydrogenase